MTGEVARFLDVVCPERVAAADRTIDLGVDFQLHGDGLGALTGSL